jgi:hypothetical protein
VRQGVVTDVPSGVNMDRRAFTNLLAAGVAGDFATGGLSAFVPVPAVAAAQTLALKDLVPKAG